MIMKANPVSYKHIVAFEVAKHELVSHALPDDCQISLANNPAQIRRHLKTRMKAVANKPGDALLVVCEATGGYERHVLKVCGELGLAVHRAHGSRVRFFAKYLGLAKTDPIDARVLALYGARSEILHLYRAPSPQEAELKELRARRDQVLGILRAESNRLEHARHSVVRKGLKAHIAALKKMLAGLEGDIANLISSHDDFARKAGLMQTVKGIGPVSAMTLLAEMPELGRMTKGEAARLAGLAPINNDSGQHKGRRHIEPGRASIRRCLYMAAVVAMHRNVLIQEFAARLRARGKPGRVVIAAVMRKLLITLNGILKSGKPWHGAKCA